MLYCCLGGARLLRGLLWQVPPSPAERVQLAALAALAPLARVARALLSTAAFERARRYEACAVATLATGWWCAVAMVMLHPACVGLEGI